MDHKRFNTWLSFTLIALILAFASKGNATQWNLWTGFIYDNNTSTATVTNAVVNSSLTVPTGPMSARTTPAVVGDLYYDTDFSQLESYNGAAWVGFSSPSLTLPTRAVNTCFQISSTRNSQAIYSVNIGTSLSLTGGTSGTIFLEMSDDNACSVNTKELAEVSNAQTGTLTIGLALNQGITPPLSALIIPAGKWIRLRTSNVVGTPTYAVKASQEVTL